MNALTTLITVLPWYEWLALGWFFAAWVGYARFARARAAVRPSILASTNRVRREWMLQSTYREVRVVDGVVAQSLGASPSFFASTSILVIGGLLAVLGTADKATELVKELPFVARTSVLVFDLKLILLLMVFIYAFFRFTWSLRQYSFGALLIGAMPEPKQFDAGQASREAYARRAGGVMALAAETFNDGLRAYYLSFALIGWFFSPLVFALATAFVVWVLYQREFRSEVLDVLNGSLEG